MPALLWMSFQDVWFILIVSIDLRPIFHCNYLSSQNSLLGKSWFSSALFAFIWRMNDFLLKRFKNYSYRSVYTPNQNQIKSHPIPCDHIHVNVGTNIVVRLAPTSLPELVSVSSIWLALDSPNPNPRHRLEMNWASERTVIVVAGPSIMELEF